MASIRFYRIQPPCLGAVCISRLATFSATEIHTFNTFEFAERCILRALYNKYTIGAVSSVLAAVTTLYAEPYLYGSFFNHEFVAEPILCALSGLWESVVTGRLRMTIDLSSPSSGGGSLVNVARASGLLSAALTTICLASELVRFGPVLCCHTAVCANV